MSQDESSKQLTDLRELFDDTIYAEDLPQAIKMERLRSSDEDTVINELMISFYQASHLELRKRLLFIPWNLSTYVLS